MDSKRVGYFWVAVLVFLVLWDYLGLLEVLLGVTVARAWRKRKRKSIGVLRVRMRAREGEGDEREERISNDVWFL